MQKGKFTITLDPEIQKRAAAEAQKTSRTFSGFVEWCLKLQLKETKEGSENGTSTEGNHA